ncbi:MAG: hypothetical protein PF693_21735 [Spirochaetia bacterium]|jgi:hypothetical protein|nr:hypothetical protein [Spirochaetia bacterium]
MSYKIYRRIHPVGQGQCISESHSEGGNLHAKICFDCGAGNNANKKELDRITQVEISGGG